MKARGFTRDEDYSLQIPFLLRILESRLKQVNNNYFLILRKQNISTNNSSFFFECRTGFQRKRPFSVRHARV